MQQLCVCVCVLARAQSIVNFQAGFASLYFCCTIRAGRAATHHILLRLELLSLSHSGT